MSEMEEKLSAILSNPDAMGQIMSIAQSLSGSSGESNETAPPQNSDAQTAQPPPGGQGGPDLSGLLNMLGSFSSSDHSPGSQRQESGGGDTSGSPLGGIDPRILQMMLRILGEWNTKDDRKTALLTALRPFLKEERQAKIDRAMQIAKLSRVIRIAFQSFKGGVADV